MKERASWGEAPGEVPLDGPERARVGEEGGERAAPPGAPAEAVWHTLTVEETERLLRTGKEGLDAAEARRRLELYGPNEVEPERFEPWWSILLHQFRSPLIYILIVAAVVTLLLREYADSGVILAVVVLNAVIGFVQEYRAREAMRALAQLSAPQAEVVREGRPSTIPSRELVPGDVVVLSSGTRVPADLRLDHVQALEVDESALTGESVAAGKTTGALSEKGLVPGDRTNMAFAATTATRGRGRGIVVRSGGATELGRIAQAVREAGQTATPLQQKLDRFGRQVGWVILSLSGVVAAIGLAYGMAPAEIFMVAVAMAVASIPEGLPIVLTVTLAIGVRRMARKRAIIRSLPAVETLGSTTVIGSDKTGTLTRNQMTVRIVWAGGKAYEVSGVGYAPEGALAVEGGRAEAGERPALERPALERTIETGVLANEADAGAVEAGEPVGDPTEIALHVLAFKGGGSPTAVRERFRQIDMLPFEPELRLMATLDEAEGRRRVHVKGAPEAVLAICDRMLWEEGEGPLDARAVREVAGELAGRGLRVLAMAYRETGAESLGPAGSLSGFTLAGLTGMEDPVRPEAVAAVAEAQRAGIRVLMLTGDHVDTARAIGSQLGLRGDARSGEELYALPDAALDEVLRETGVFARVAPEQKLRIVERLKEGGEVVAVTGDGVNDAPALRAAHLGVAMGASGTDVAREASDMVLSDDNFATLTAAVEEGRIVFANIRKVTFFLLSTASGQIITILFALLAGWPLPFVAAQLLWINLVTNGLQDVALAFEPGEPGLLRRAPRPLRQNVITARLLSRLGAVGLVLAAGTLAMFFWAWQGTGDVAYARTVAMTQMVVFQFFHVFNCRSLSRSILRIPPLSNPFLFASLVAAALAHGAVLTVPVLQALFRTVPLGAEELLLIVLVGSTVILGAELDKWRNHRRRDELG